MSRSGTLECSKHEGDRVCVLAGKQDSVPAFWKSMGTVAIINPKSANGKTAEIWSRVRGYLPSSVEVFETKFPGHGIELTAAALRMGAQTVIAVGGDGTINEVSNGFFDDDKVISETAALGIIPHGTGSDFRRSLNLPKDEQKAAEVINRGNSRPIDIARVSYTTMDGKTAVRYSINLTSFGMGGAVARKANRSSKALGGKVSFLMATLSTALSYTGKDVTCTIDGTQTIRMKISNVAAGNGQYHGGGMWVCPDASLEDGLLDLTFIEYLSLPKLVRSLPFLYNGRIYSHSSVEAHRARLLEARSEDTTLIEIDGEPLGKLPIRIETIAKAIRVLFP